MKRESGPGLISATLSRQFWHFVAEQSGRARRPLFHDSSAYSGGGCKPVLGGVVVEGEVVLLGGAPTVGDAPAEGHGELTEAPVLVVAVVLEEVPAPTWLLPVPT